MLDLLAKLGLIPPPVPEEEASPEFQARLERVTTRARSVSIDDTRNATGGGPYGFLWPDDTRKLVLFNDRQMAAA